MAIFKVSTANRAVIWLLLRVAITSLLYKSIIVQLYLIFPLDIGKYVKSVHHILLGSSTLKFLLIILPNILPSRVLIFTVSAAKPAAYPRKIWA